MESMIEPRLIKRHCGGWLAVSSNDAAIKLGVTADTKEEATAKFHQSVARWTEILSGPVSADIHCGGGI